MSTLQRTEQFTQNLLDENIQLKHIIAGLPGAIFWKDKNSAYLGCNQYFLDMAGLDSIEQVIGKTDYDLPWCCEADNYRRNDKKAMLSKPNSFNSFEERAILADGRALLYTVLKSPLCNATGKVIGIIGAALDISQHKKLSEKLQIAQKKAASASQAKTELIANMSHDIKTPLSGMIGMAELLSHRLREENNIEFAQTISIAGQQLLKFFDDCLEAAQLEDAAITLNKECFDLKALLDTVIQLFEPAIKNKGLTLYINYDNNLPNHLLGSRIGVHRVLLNLLSNAVKFTHSGSITVGVKLSKKSTSKEVIIKLTVTDTGIGIPKDQQQNIFERFIRLVPSYKGIYEGNGLGLYIAKKSAEAMGGEIYVKSEEEKGSQFLVALPLEVPLLEAEEYEQVMPIF